MTDFKPVDTNLDALAAAHREERSAEGTNTPIDRPRLMRIQLPAGGHLPASSRWLERLYAGERMPREKKPMVFDHQRSFGPWMVSVDDEPMSVLDGMSQTATLASGFASDQAVNAYFNGAFDGLLLRSPDTTLEPHPQYQRYVDALKSQMPGLPHIAFTNSGAEANEKALALCKLNAVNPQATKIIAFEGSFHGRTLQALHATWNPKKRAPYELPGFEIFFAPFPMAAKSTNSGNRTPDGYLSACGRADFDALDAMAEAGGLIAAEVASLHSVHDALSTGTVYALMVEPMQSEGGDRYGGPRFYRALRLLTRHHKVSMIVDEVQTGFGLGGPFSWGLSYEFVDVDGRPDLPDAMTWAKRAQVGFVSSRFEDPEPTHAHVASMVRGRLHAESIGDGSTACHVQGEIAPRLRELMEKYPDLVQGVRQQGFAFAFDLPTPKHMLAYIKQRFWRGAVVFAAGTRTIRYRLSDTYGPREIQTLFKTIHATLDWLTESDSLDVPTWQDHPDPRPKANTPYRIRQPDRTEAAGLLRALLEIESAAYEPARRDTPETLSVGLEHPDGIAVVAEVESPDGWRVVGSALAGPLESFTHVEGPDKDPHLGAQNTAYSIAITIHPDHHGQGMGTALKQAQLRATRALQTPAGTPRYTGMTGRNRVGLAASMTHLNRIFGAYEVKRLTGQYGEADGEAIYYRIPVQSWAPPSSTCSRLAMNWAHGLSNPLASPPESLVALKEDGGLFGPAVTKITICNYITPAIVRAIEWVGALNPEHPHLYLTSCRDELVDKTIRTLKHTRKNGIAAVGLTGGYLGHTSAGARALSDPKVHRMGTAARSWPLIAHPGDSGIEAMGEALREVIDELGGSDAVLGLFVEPVQERTGQVLTDDHWQALAAFRDETGIPIISMETASAGYRAQDSAFATDNSPCSPDIRAWWPGGQTGFIHLKSDYFVPNPLTMVSTWDGDELSMIRAQHNLMATRKIHRSKPAKVLDTLASRLSDLGYTTYGQGFYRVIHLEQSPWGVREKLKASGLIARAFPNGTIALIPPLDITEEEMQWAADQILAVFSNLPATSKETP